MLTKPEATIWDLPSPIHKASNYESKVARETYFCSNEFLSYSEFQVFSLRIVLGFGGLKLISSVWVAAVFGFTVDLASKLTDNKTPKHKKNKTNQNQTDIVATGVDFHQYDRPKSCLLPDSSRSIKKYHVADKNVLLVAIHCQQKRSHFGKRTLQSCLFDFHVNHLKKEELKYRL